MDDTRNLKQDAYIRICKDSDFQLDYLNAAILTAKVIGCHPLEVWMALDFYYMQKIATGNHPVCENNG